MPQTTTAPLATRTEQPAAHTTRPGAGGAAQKGRTMNDTQEETAYREAYAILREHLPVAELERLMGKVAASLHRGAYTLSRRAVAEGLLRAGADSTAAVTGEGATHDTAEQTRQPTALTRDSAAVGVAINFRGRRRVITETCPTGVWLEKRRRCGVHTDIKCECRDFIGYAEAERFGVTVE